MTEYYSVTKGNELSLNETILTNLENMLTERSHTQKGTYYTAFTWDVQNGQTHGDRKLRLMVAKDAANHPTMKRTSPNNKE